MFTLFVFLLFLLVSLVWLKRSFVATASIGFRIKWVVPAHLLHLLSAAHLLQLKFLCRLLILQLLGSVSATVGSWFNLWANRSFLARWSAPSFLLGTETALDACRTRLANTTTTSAFRCHPTHSNQSSSSHPHPHCSLTGIALSRLVFATAAQLQFHLNCPRHSHLLPTVRSCSAAQ